MKVDPMLTDMLRRTLDQRIDITLDAEEALCLADPMQLESSLLNVAINARDAMPQRGSIRFACRPVASLPEGLDADNAHRRDDGYVAIWIPESTSCSPTSCSAPANAAPSRRMPHLRCGPGFRCS